MSDRGRAPLSFAQLLSLVLAVTVTVLLVPVGVRAAGQLVSIGDGDSDTDAVLVDAGKLRVGDGGGNLTVDGSVTIGVPNSAYLAQNVPANGRAALMGQQPI